ncbi:MAG: thioredoxin domain-containing protein, partial [Humibacter sp.]
AEQPRPALDEKVLTGWNGLAIGALAHAGALLGRPDWVAAAASVADSLLTAHVRADGTLIRASLAGRASAAAPALEDYGLFARGVLDVFLATGEPRFALAARSLVDATMDGAVAARSPFTIPGGGDPVLAAHGLVSDADPSEGVYPGGLSSLADACRVLFALTDDERYERASRTAIGSVADVAARSPIAFGGVLQTATALAGELQQLVVVDPRKPGEAIVRETAVRTRSLGAGAVGVAVADGAASTLSDAGFALFDARTALNDEPTEYLCRAFTCELPRPFAPAD